MRDRGERLLGQRRLVAGHGLLDFSGEGTNVAGAVSRGIDVGEVRGNDLMAERAQVEHALQTTHQRGVDHGHGCSLGLRTSWLRTSLLDAWLFRSSVFRRSSFRRSLR